jgi:ATP-binding cassette subfamily B protein
MISRVCAELVKQAFENLMHHSYRFFSNSFAGALTRQVSRFAAAYENLYYSLVVTVLEAIVYILGITGVLLYRNWMLGSIMFFWVVIFVYLQWKMSRWQQPLRLMRAEEDSNMIASLADG